MNAIFGQLFETPLAIYDQGSSCWRTFGDTSVSDSPTYSPTLPVSGSMRNGELFDRPMSAHLTGENAFTSLLATPTAWLGRRPSHSVIGPSSLAGRARELIRDIAVLLPTPTAAQPGGTAEQHLERKRKMGRANPTVTDLRMAVQLLPTPRAALSDGRNSTPWIRPAHKPQNLENAIAHVIGENGNQLLTDGNTPQGDQHPTLWTIEEDLTQS